MENYKIIIQLLIPCICLYLIFIKNILCSSCLVNYSEEREGDVNGVRLVWSPRLDPGDLEWVQDRLGWAQLWFLGLRVPVPLPSTIPQLRGVR